jgi:hypothetical protein
MNVRRPNDRRLLESPNNYPPGSWGEWYAYWQIPIFLLAFFAFAIFCSYFQ